MVEPAVTYDPAFYDIINAGSIRSAEVVVPLLIHRLGKPRHIVDVGCGEGAWTSVFAAHDIEVLGLDGDYIATERLLIPPDRFRPTDLTEPLEIDERFDWHDWAVSLEVAEHLPPERAESFVGDLCTLADTVIFSAAIPRQGGTGHLNEQWPTYWEPFFNDRGYTMSGALRFEIWDDDRIENWYRQNIMVCMKNPEGPLFTGPTVKPIPMVHPVLWDAYRGVV